MQKFAEAPFTIQIIIKKRFCHVSHIAKSFLHLQVMVKNSTIKLANGILGISRENVLMKSVAKFAQMQDESFKDRQDSK